MLIESADMNINIKHCKRKTWFAPFACVMCINYVLYH